MLTLPEDKHGFSYAYVFVNALTKYTLIFPAKDKTAQHAAMAILQHASIVGLTSLIWSDNGSEFVSEISTAVALAMGSTWQYTLAYRPQANSHVERVNGEILRHIRVLLCYDETWDSWSSPAVISLTQMAINTRVHTTTKYSPVELTFGTTARQYFKNPLDLARQDGEALMDFNEGLGAVHYAAELNTRAARMPRLANQPDTVVTYQHGDFVLRDPRKMTGQTDMRTHKLELNRHGPYMVVIQEDSLDGASNTVVVQEVNDSSRTHKFHHSTLYPFSGSKEEAQELARIDRQEHRLQSVLSIVGNTSDRDTLQVNVRYTDGTTSAIPYNVAAHTQVFADWCTGTIVGRELSLTRQELAQWKLENAVAAGQTPQAKMESWPADERLQIGDRIYISAHFWNCNTWHTHMAGVLPGTMRNREPLLLATIDKITAKRVDIAIPHLHLHHGRKKFVSYIKPMTLQNLRLWTCKAPLVNEHMQVIMGVPEFSECSLKEDLQRAARMIK